MTPLTPRVERVIARLFPLEGARVSLILQNECAGNLPLIQTAAQIERIQLGVLRMSAGDFERFTAAVHMAQTDWRDVLMNSGFASDLQAHLRWADELDG